MRVGRICLVLAGLLAPIGCGDSEDAGDRKATTGPATAPAAATEPAAGRPTVALHEAAEKGNVEQVVAHIAAGSDLNAYDAQGKTALMYAAEMHEFEVVKRLLQAGADVHLPSQGTITGFTAVHYAAGHGDNRIIELLLGAGAKVDVKGMWNATALHQAAFNGHGATVLLLLDRGADPNAVKDDGSTPLHDLSRASSINLDAIKALLAAKVKVDARDARGRTPLHHAAGQGHKAIVRILLDAGAEVNAKDKSGRTPLYYANRRRKQEVVALLKARGGTQ